MTDPLQIALADLFHAAGGCAYEGDLRGVNLCMIALRPLLAEVDARLNPIEYEVVLESFGDHKIRVIKEVRSMQQNLGANPALKETKDLVETAPGAIILTVKGDADAEVYAQKLRNAGGTAIVRAKAVNA